MNYFEVLISVLAVKRCLEMPWEDITGQIWEVIQLERKIASPQVGEAFVMTKTGLSRLDCQRKD